jgi:hypothetical protein
MHPSVQALDVQFNFLSALSDLTDTKSQVTSAPFVVEFQCKVWAVVGVKGLLSVETLRWVGMSALV